MCSSSPDTHIAQQAALENTHISKEAMDWAQQIYAETAPDRAAASTAAREQASVQRDLSLQSLQTQREQADRYRTTFQPVEDRIVSDAMAYNTPQRQEAMAGQAMADVGSQFSLSRDATAREAAARGVDPSSGNFAASMARQAIQEAAAKAAAGNTARMNTEAVGSAKMMDAAGIGRGVISNQATQAQIGLTSGNSSVNNANAPNVIAQGGSTQLNQGFQTAMSGNSSAGNLSLGVTNAQTGVDNANGQTAAAAGTAVAGVAIAI